MSSALDMLKLNRSSAATEEAVFAHWQDYRRWLRLRIELLDARHAETSTTVAFDESDELDSHARATMIEESLRSISAESQAVFERALDLRLNEARAEVNLSQTQRLNLDAERDLERQTLVALLDECEGKATDDGLGLVPVDPDAEAGWYAVALRALESLPSDATYAIQEKTGWSAYRTRLVFFGFLVAGAIVFILWPYLFVSAEAMLTDVLTGSATYNEWPLPAYVPSGLTLEMQNGDPLVMQVEARETQQFPPDLAQDAPTDVLYWEDAGISYPARLCVPETVPMADLKAIIVHDGTYLPARTYRMAETGQTADLLIVPCAGGEPLAAMIDTVAPLAMLTPGEDAAVSNTTALSVRGIEVISADRDPDLPPETVRVDVQVVVEGDPPDWTALRPRLLLATGVEYAMIGTPQDRGDGSVAVSYGVDTPQYAREALWVVTPDPGHALRWQLTVTPPLPRAIVLAQELALGDPVVTIEDNHLHLELPITNTGRLPLALQPSDLQVSYADLAPNETPAPLLDGLSTPLAAGEERTIAIIVPWSGNRTLTVALGSARFDINPEGR